MGEETESRVLGQSYLENVGTARAAVRGLLHGEDGSTLTGARITILDSDDSSHELEVAVGETFPAGGGVWRLDGVERFETDKIGGRHLEATVSRVG